MNSSGAFRHGPRHIYKFIVNTGRDELVVYANTFDFRGENIVFMYDGEVALVVPNGRDVKIRMIECDGIEV